MLLVGGAHEIVVADVEEIESVAENLGDSIHEFLRLQSRGDCGAIIFVAMLIGAGDESDVLFAKLAPIVARENIGGERFGRVSDVRRSVAIEYRRGDDALDPDMVPEMRN